MPGIQPGLSSPSACSEWDGTLDSGGGGGGGGGGFWERPAGVSSVDSGGAAVQSTMVNTVM